ncbi:class I SAM-dependent methyltransferase [Faecalibacter bovis]|uniref:Methyltransferase domain-containing protein n=1 Tax=Faecalibacter bovis TaxID=2898187 RepID=A0ABX7XFQ1_9FLAO|nr:methyltransferase domain-containing protein [Faecalibacter bovis]QTV06710.1 methyltransferase domain-containing protein [Faecalibacter bovis]
MSIYQNYKSTFTSENVIKFNDLLNNIEFEKLGLTDYNLNYILGMKPTFFYYIQLFDFSVQEFVSKNDFKDKWIIDFGGGHGFLSLYLKLLGFKVIYCDFNPNSVKTAQKIAQSLGFGPDYYVTGSSEDILKLVRQENLNVEYLISTDTIEHVYDLDEMFKNLVQINPKIKMIFTTASNFDNKIKSKKLQKAMIKDEVEDFIPKRKSYISKNYLNLNDDEINLLAEKSRGLRYVDLDDFVKFYQEYKTFQKINIDSYNCCEPEFGAWTERILPLNYYKNLGEKHGLKLAVDNSFYCEIDKTGIKKIIVKALNYFILNNPKYGIKLAPIIVLKYQ